MLVKWPYYEFKEKVEETEYESAVLLSRTHTHTHTHTHRASERDCGFHTNSLISALSHTHTHTHTHSMTASTDMSHFLKLSLSLFSLTHTCTHTSL